MEFFLSIRIAAANAFFYHNISPESLTVKWPDDNMDSIDHSRRGIFDENDEYMYWKCLSC